MCSKFNPDVANLNCSLREILKDERLVCQVCSENAMTFLLDTSD
jgi:hypothetical protein